MIKAAAVFSDNMVLQRNKNVRIFGVCSEDITSAEVTVPELEVSARAVVKDGKWTAVLPPMKECSACTVIISAKDERIIFTNAAVGEVWLAGGQSNMEFELQNEKYGSQALEECENENVRFYYTPKCEMSGEKLFAEEEKSCWSLPGKQSAGRWSAVGYYFARELSRRLGVTVGVIGCNWGGTSASAWMSRDCLENDRLIRPYIDDYDNACEGKTAEQMVSEYDEYTAYHTAWEARMQKCYAEDPAIKWEKVLEICGENRYPGPMGCKNPMRPCGLYETMVSRVCPYTLAGFIYYQGESDDHRPETYDRLLSTLISCWRRDWMDDKLPFMLVQLPMFKFETDPDTGNWAILREKQMKVFNTVKNTGIAVALDCGEFNNIHPIDKTETAHRLYLQAMYHVYGDGDRMKAFPPIYRDFEVCGSVMKLRFDDCDGFEVKGELTGFEIAGEDGCWHEAAAEIKGSEILLSGEAENPVSARYNWKNYAEVTLFGKNGIPVPPFRVG